MAVEILILSGARQGERLVFEGEQFRAGDEPACEVFFNPARDPAAQGRMLLFRHSEDGWSVLPMGSPGIMLDHDPVADATTIRSGQVVRMSADGPDFSFRVVAASAAKAAAFALVPAVLPAPVGGADAGRVSNTPGRQDAWSPGAGLDLEAAAVATAAAPSLVPPTPPAEKEAPTTHLVLISTLAGIGLAALVILAGWAVLAALRGRPTPVEDGIARVEAPKHEDQVPPAPPQAPPAETPKPETPKAEAPQVAASEPKPEPKPVAESWEAALEPVRGSVYLLQVEQTMPDGSTMAWPFAGCCAVSEKALLTTGNVGCELLRFRYKKFKVYVTRPEDKYQQEVTEIRIRSDYFEHENDRARQRYCDLALLSVAGRLPAPVEVAADEDLSRLEKGLHLGLLSYAHEGNNVTAHDVFPLKATEGRVFLIRALEPETPGTPLCLDLTAQMPANAYGSPVFLRGGKLVGVYNEPPEEGEARGIKNLHFITVVHPQLIELGLRDHDEALWVEPKVQAAAGSGKKP